MRVALGIVAAALAAKGAVAAPITADQCAERADAMRSASAIMGELLGSIEGKSYAQVGEGSPSALIEARDEAEAARVDLVSSLTRFKAAAEDLTYQFQLCARQ